MTMASEVLCVSSQGGSDLPGDDRIHGHAECRSSFSCPYGHHGKSSPEEVNDTSSYRESCLEENLLASDDAQCSFRVGPDESESRDTDEHVCFHGKGVRCEAHCAAQSQQYLRPQKGSTLQELYMQEQYDDEDDDDSDWEPVNHLVIEKWFCPNCTMPNFDDVCLCDACGEHKESELLTHSHIGKQAQASIAPNAVPKHQDSSSDVCTAIGFDERMLLHSEVEMKSHPHPERPDRLRAIAASLATAGIFPGKCSLIPAREITREELQMVHTSDHIEAVQQTSHMLSSYFTSDTYANEYSACAARIAAGLCADLATSIMSGHNKNGFALVRPPGHHAGIKQAMGFCLHNNAAVAALAAQSAGAKKVLIVDWDVHHGNGTQEIFDNNKSVLYISLHRHEDGRFYPGTGAAYEVGNMDGKGYSVNIPWSCGGVGDNDYIFAFQQIVLPIASEFAPDLTIISAGFDAARGDPLGCCDVTPAGYAQMTYLLSELLEGKLLVILEGGYNLRSISTSATAVVKVLLGENPGYEMSTVMPSKAGLKTIIQVLKIQLKFWPVLESNYRSLQSTWDLVTSNNKKNAKKRKRVVGPLWWRWGSKRFVYDLLYGDMFFTKGKRHAKSFCGSHRRWK